MVKIFHPRRRGRARVGFKIGSRKGRNERGMKGI